MAGIIQISPGVATAAGAASLPVFPDTITDYGWTHRYEAYAAPQDIGASVPTLKDLIGTSDATPNGGPGTSGGSAGALGFVDQRIGVQLGGLSRYATATFAQGAACTIVGLLRPTSAAYTPGEQKYLFAKSGGTGSRNVWLDGQSWNINGGGTLSLANSVKNGVWQIVTAVFNGASSVLRVDGQEVTGNAGTDAPSGLTIGAQAALTPTNTLTCWFGAAYFAPRALTPAERAAFEAQLRTLHRLPAV